MIFLSKARQHRKVTKLQFTLAGRKHEPKAQLELKLSSVISDNKKGCLRMLIARGGLWKTLDHYSMKILT